MIQAFKSLEPEHITPQHLEHLRKTLPAAERAQIQTDLDLAPGWMRPMLRELAQDGPAPVPEQPARKIKR